MADQSEFPTDSVTVVYIHGVGPKPPLNVLKLAWDMDLFGHDLGDNSRMAYWADLRYPEAGDADVDVVTMEELMIAIHPWTPTAVHAPLENFLADTIKELSPKGAALAVALTDRLLAHVSALEKKREAQPEILPLPRPLRQWVFRRLLEVFFRDVDAYLFAGQGEDMRKRLRDCLATITGPVLIIGHSLGSVIAYDVLSEQASAGLDVKLFMTVGSPLGIEEIQTEVAQPLQVCPPVVAWDNFADTWDLIALDKTLSDEFAPEGAISDARVRNPSPNHHSAPGYLRAPLIRRAAHSAISS